MHNLGRCSLNEIKQRLAEVGLRLDMPAATTSGNSVITDEQVERLINAVERCEVLLMRISEQRMTFTFPPPQYMQSQSWLEQQTPQAMQQKLPPE
jgi:hypothetical protein